MKSATGRRETGIDNSTQHADAGRRHAEAVNTMQLLKSMQHNFWTFATDQFGSRGDLALACVTDVFNV
jgi:ABC-type protease/lipase transport system fused ATPase/permease subunit